MKEGALSVCYVDFSTDGSMDAAVVHRLQQFTHVVIASEIQTE